MRNVMTRAWEIYRELQGDHTAKLAMALRMAWAEAKAVTEKEELTGTAQIVIPGRENYGDESMYLNFKAWAKADKKRIYINDYKRRTLGYIENGTLTITDTCGISRVTITAMFDTFAAKYAC